MIITVKEWNPKIFDEKMNQYLSEDFVILNITCGFEGNIDEGSDAVFIAILQKPEEEP